jgi:hypothetical protein
VPTSSVEFAHRVRRFLERQGLLGREDRRTLSENFQAGVTWNVDFVVMIGLSTALFAFGLPNNSPAAVIGGMLVAPLMSPLPTGLHRPACRPGAHREGQTDAVLWRVRPQRRASSTSDAGQAGKG